MANPITAMVKALATELREISGLTVREGWPPANQPLTMPSVTILKGKATYTNAQPYELEKTSPNGDNETTVKWIVGQYDMRLQLDLWCRNQAERDTRFEQIFAALNPSIEAPGLSLELSDYHGLFASCSLLDHEFMDDEAAAQRQEWRIRLEVAANVLAVLSTTEYAMISFENTLTTPDNIEDEDN